MNMKKNNRKPIVVAGPCSVESKAQLQAVAEALAPMPQVRLIRAGVWKPRTRPGGFEGIGEPALGWMKELREGALRMADGSPLRFCCEVARPEHVELCLRYGIEDVWVGARTSVNPFMVEELCEAFRGVRLNVLVKNPSSPDVRLWVGAVERVRRVAQGDVVAVHRGFSTYDNGGYRNAPLWQLAMELRRELPDVPLLCDPSHIGGRRELVPPLCRTAVQLAYDGLMVEVHPSPDAALTDAAQQLTPARFATLLSELVSLSSDGARTSDSSLELLRGEIDEVDRQLLGLLARRMDVSRRIATVKQQKKMTVFQAERWQQLMKDRLQTAREEGLDADFVSAFLEMVHAESVRVQLNS